MSDDEVNDAQEMWRSLQTIAASVKQNLAAAIAQPKPVWVTIEEGGDYIPWKEWTLGWEDPGERWKFVPGQGYAFTGAKHKFRIHSVGFDNGWVFDNCGGWREWNPDHLTPAGETSYG